MAAGDISSAVFDANTLHRRLFPPGTTPVGSLAGPLGSFTPDSQFQPTPEAARILNYLEETSGKQINVKPFSSVPKELGFINEKAFGVYFGGNPEGGDSYDPKARTVYLNPQAPGNNVAVLAHELGHAFDPNLPRDYEAYGSSSPARIRSLNTTTALQNPVGFLNTYMLGPEVKVRLETEAQRAATDTLQNIGYPTKQFTDDPWYKGYPGSFVDTGLDQAASLYSLPLNVPRGVPTKMIDFQKGNKLGSMGQGDSRIFAKRPALGPDDPEIDFTDELTRRLLDLGLNKKYQQAEERIRSRNKEYIESRLGR